MSPPQMTGRDGVGPLDCLPPRRLQFWSRSHGMADKAGRSYTICRPEIVPGSNTYLGTIGRRPLRIPRRRISHANVDSRRSGHRHDGARRGPGRISALTEFRKFFMPMRVVTYTLQFLPRPAQAVDSRRGGRRRAAAK